MRENDPVTMNVWRSLAEVPTDLGPTVVTIGNFDGVHLGHQALLGDVVEHARPRGAAAVAVTFDPHPRAVHAPDSAVPLLTGLDDRLERMAATGLDATLVEQYTLDFAAATAREFVRDHLVDGLGAVAVVVGADTKFGRGNEGDVQTMRDLGAEFGFEVLVTAPAAPAPGEERACSSSWVRELLVEGDVARAAQVLGRPHRVRGIVQHGDKIGREIGFPTANLLVTAGMIPAHGVYAGRVTVTAPGPSGEGEDWVGQRLPAAVSLGINYTVGGTDLRVEAHLIDLEGLDLYGAEVALDFVDRRRDMLDFGSLDALIVALGEDVEWCRDVLGLAKC